MARKQTREEWVKGFLSRCRPDPDGECVLWSGGDDGGNGYGKTRTHVDFREEAGFPQTAMAHRVAYWLARGPFDTGLVLDHVHGCRPRCVNPYHLEPTTVAKNAIRANVQRWYGASSAEQEESPLMEPRAAEAWELDEPAF